MKAGKQVGLEKLGKATISEVMEDGLVYHPCIPTVNSTSYRQLI
jgi:hypothetical protein